MPESESEMPYSIEYSHISYIGVPKMKNANFEITHFDFDNHIDIPILIFILSYS